MPPYERKFFRNQGTPKQFNIPIEVSMPGILAEPQMALIDTGATICTMSFVMAQRLPYRETGTMTKIGTASDPDNDEDYDVVETNIKLGQLMPVKVRVAIVPWKSDYLYLGMNWFNEVKVTWEYIKSGAYWSLQIDR